MPKTTPEAELRSRLLSLHPETPLTVDETATVLGVSPKTLSKWRWRPSLNPNAPRFRKIGRRVAYLVGDVVAALQATDGARGPA